MMSRDREREIKIQMETVLDILTISGGRQADLVYRHPPVTQGKHIHIDLLRSVA